MGFLKKSDIEKIENYINKGFKEEISLLSECRKRYEEAKKGKGIFSSDIKKESLKRLGETVEANEKAALSFLSGYDFLNRPETEDMKNIAMSSKTALDNFFGTPDKEPSKDLDFLDDSVRLIHELSKKTEDPGMKKKLSDTEGYLTQIWKKEPKNRHHDVYRKLSDYYLPTAEKLLNAYIDAQGKPGSNPETIKAEAERGIDILNQVLINISNDTYGDAAMDISTESNVLSMIARRDGLISGDDFNK